MIIGVRVPYPADTGGGTWSQNPPPSSEVTKIPVESQYWLCATAFTSWPIHASPSPMSSGGSVLYPTPGRTKEKSGRVPSDRSVKNCEPVVRSWVSADGMIWSQIVPLRIDVGSA